MTNFDRLSEVRDVARARAREDFEYFANHVMGAQLPEPLCMYIQRRLEKNPDALVRTEQFNISPGRKRALSEAFPIWLALQGKSAVPSGVTRTETFEWLFGSELERMAA